jgi:hypothetical protein
MHIVDDFLKSEAGNCHTSNKMGNLINKIYFAVVDNFQCLSPFYTFLPSTCPMSF